MRGFSRGLLAAAISALMLPVAAQAADKALVIGVGKHIHVPANDLPGIDLDVDMARDLASMMGFDNVVQLRDRQATLDNVRKALAGLAQGTGASDRVLIYFSGHGMQVPDDNGDEADKMDEALVLSDVRAESGRVAGVLLDDEFDKLLARIPAAQVTVLIDACHSGTATKAFTLARSRVDVASSRGLGPGVTEMYEKSIKYADIAGRPAVSSRAYGVAAKPEMGGGNVVAVSAAADHQYARATSKGSLFTLGLNQAMSDAKAAQSGNLTLKTMHEVATRFIAEHAKPEQVHNPQITGNVTLAERPVKLAATTEGGGPNWRDAEEVVRRGAPLKISLNSRAHREGEKLLVAVDVPSEGYLNVLSIGPDDVPVVLFPNGFNQDNRVSPGQLTLPTPQMTFDLEARKPFGVSMVVAFLTKEPINLYQSAEGDRDSKGVLNDVIPRVSKAGMRAYGVQARPEAGQAQAPASGGVPLLAGRVISRVCAASGPCDAPRN